MILPERLSIIGGSAARQALTAPMRLVWMVSAQASGLVESNGPMGPCTPAETIRTSRRPNSRSMRATALFISARLRTSAGRRKALPPACSISSFARSSSALLRASNPICAPASAKPMARRLPTPRPAPVMRQIVQSRRPLQQVFHAGEGVAQEAGVVSHILDRRIDFVGDAGGKLPNRFQFLGLRQLPL